MVIGFLVFASGGKRMPNKKTIALTLAVSMLAPMLMSCARNSAKDITVKPDDPWYETVRFDLEMDRKPAELVDSSVVTYGNDRLYHLYSLCNLADYTNYRRSMLDTYDSNGNLIDSDTDYTDNCVCTWTPRWTGNFRIKIVNRGGVYNRYILRTN